MQASPASIADALSAEEVCPLCLDHYTAADECTCVTCGAASCPSCAETIDADGAMRCFACRPPISTTTPKRVSTTPLQLPRPIPLPLAARGADAMPKGLPPLPFPLTNSPYGVRKINRKPPGSVFVGLPPIAPALSKSLSPRRKPVHPLVVRLRELRALGHYRAARAQDRLMRWARHMRRRLSRWRHRSDQRLAHWAYRNEYRLRVLAERLPAYRRMLRERMLVIWQSVSASRARARARDSARTDAALHGVAQELRPRGLAHVEGRFGRALGAPACLARPHAATPTCAARCNHSFERQLPPGQLVVASSCSAASPTILVSMQESPSGGGRRAIIV